MQQSTSVCLSLSLCVCLPVCLCIRSVDFSSLSPPSLPFFLSLCLSVDKGPFPIVAAYLRFKFRVQAADRTRFSLCYFDN